MWAKKILAPMGSEKWKIIWRECRRQLIFLLPVVLWILGFRLLRQSRPAMNWIARRITTPIKQTAAKLSDLVPFSVTELLICLAVLLGTGFLVRLIWDLAHCRRWRFPLLLRRLLFLLCIALTAYGGYVYLWGVNYYTDTFQEQSGIYARAPTVDELCETAFYFAQELNRSGREVARDEQGLYAEEIEQVIADSARLYDSLSEEFPFLAGDPVRPKPFFFSELLSFLNTTGFFSPWVGESNFNNHSPACDRPATIAHELAHQRGVASEQEANFVAVLASTRSDSAAYRYSGYLLGYTYLNNALIKADPARWQEVYSTLSPEVLADLAFIREYWDRYEGKISQAADAITDRRLKSYGQDLGRKSYGAVVDLLVVYYGAG